MKKIISLQIGIYKENSDFGNKSEFKLYDFDSVEEAISYVEFISLGYNFFKNGESLVVRLEEGSQVFLIDCNSKVPIIELKKDLLEHYNENEKIATNKEKEKISINSNFSKSKFTSLLFFNVTSFNSLSRVSTFVGKA